MADREVLHQDTFNLQRFIDAQQSTYEQARSELKAGQKRSHWMWYIFPQIAGLGFSSTAARYAISGLQEAAAYLAHPVLGPRLRECTAIVNGIQNRSIEDIFGYPDHLKFRSSVTLFQQAQTQRREAQQDVFSDALAKYFQGQPDRATLELLRL
ncbi:NTP pyrophosphohydrolase [Acidisarcina polymorpha]|uniref:NTP pyrophosphohydrolase n=1 Tax=Acidisarcina polymorpha TaxID=2211140 RepID=A0A2Z5G5G9_9BACT|nr:DUF1810 domain-containing protein [Acidisarcina polymorpha]AXC14473.1 NTP pyrophosphohydrolase [Acidisarcina polymorpha]